MRSTFFASFFVSFAASALADTPSVSFIFPAGGQRGKTVEFRVGGHYLHEGCPFRMEGAGVQASDRIERTKTIWFEGPVIPQPASQAKEDYPKDYAGKVTIAADAAPGLRTWRVTTSQGVTPGMPFVVGELPEIVEEESDGVAIPVAVTLPVTVNGRIFPREDIDIWSVEAKAGQTITCEVNAARIGSGLDPRLEVYDAKGRMLAESSDTLGNDSLLHFTAPSDGMYFVHIYDEKFGGLQHYVYRLTMTAGPWIDSVYPLGGKRGTTIPVEVRGAIPGGTAAKIAGPHTARIEVALPGTVAGVSTSAPGAATVGSHITSLKFGSETSNPVTFELDDLTEVLEPADDAAPRNLTVPGVANGRIGKAGEKDEWKFAATKGTAYEFDLRASRLGSPLDSIVTLLDSEGKQLATNDDLAGSQTDSRFTWNAPADGAYTVRVEDRLPSRGGPTFAYRLRVAPPPKPDFKLSVQGDSLTVDRTKQGNIRINAERIAGFGDEIELEIVGLPEGVEATNTKIPKGQPGTQLTFKPGEKVKIQTAALTIRGKAKIGEAEVVRTVETQSQLGAPPADRFYLAVGMPTPFKFTGIFETKFFPRGSVYSRRYPLDRNGFTGPVEVSLADRQNRHLQGVTGPVITVPPEANEFEYAVTMPPFMEIGRTSRSCLMAVGVVTDFDGTTHKVSYTSEQQNDQIITLVDPARLGISTTMKSLRVKPGATLSMPVEVARGVGLTGAVTVSLQLADHIKGVTIDPVVIPADAKSGTLTVRFSESGLGPFNRPAMLRGVIKDEKGNPVTNETPVELVAP